MCEGLYIDGLEVSKRTGNERDNSVIVCSATETRDKERMDYKPSSVKREDKRRR